MTITEYAILPFKSSPDFSDPTLRTLFSKLSEWQSDCSGFPLRFHTNAGAQDEVYLVTGWTSVSAHEAWIRGERNQELLRVFAPYVDIARVRMVHVGVNFEEMPRGGDDVIVVERYDGTRWKETPREERSGEFAWESVGLDLAQDDGDVFRFAGVAGDGEVGSVSADPEERWVLQRVKV